MRRFIILLILMVFSVPAYSATIYKWVDKDGVVNFTDDLSKVPPSYRDRVEKEERKDVKEEVTPRPPQPATRRNEEETKTDTYGRDETWWRDKVRPWNERLKEATQNYDTAQKKYNEKSDELSQRKFGSPTQYKMNIAELDRLKEERDKYAAQVSEAKAMLEKFSKEAQESKADPAWLE
jgi:chromosome segregation ATPase